jgi:hypothetical protein
MAKPLDELYFTWLYSQVGSVRNKNPSTSHWKLLKLLYTKEFVWIVPNDDNRAEDGRDLRVEFLQETPLPIQDMETHWMGLGCDMLELLIGLSRRLSFEGEGEPREWFWHLIENIELYEHTDDKPINEERVKDILDEVIWRTYLPTGKGGLFPLKEAKKDQRRVELWYQLSAYLLERE